MELRKPLKIPLEIVIDSETHNMKKLFPFLQ